MQVAYCSILLDRPTLSTPWVLYQSYIRCDLVAQLLALSPLRHLQGFEIAKKATLEFIDTFKENAEPDDRELLRCVARTSLRTKLQEKLADQLSQEPI